MMEIRELLRGSELSMSSAENDLLQRAVSGDHDALKALLDRHAPAVRRSVSRGIPRPWRALLSADDVLQQTYADAFRDIGRFDPGGVASFATWLVTIAKRNLKDAVRMLTAAKRGGDAPAMALPADGLTALYDRLTWIDSTPSRHVARQEICAALERALRRLPAIQEQVIRLHDLEGQPIPDVAAQLGRSPGAVYMLRARAHQNLREFLAVSRSFWGQSA